MKNNQDILNEIRSNCEFYIHGHSAGGTNPSLVEAMCLNLPIIAYDVSYNRMTTANSATYFKNSSDLISLLKNTNSETLAKNKAEMHRIAKENYNWKKIAENYAQLF